MIARLPFPRQQRPFSTRSLLHRSKQASMDVSLVKSPHSSVVFNVPNCSQSILVVVASSMLLLLMVPLLTPSNSSFHIHSYMCVHSGLKMVHNINIHATFQRIERILQTESLMEAIMQWRRTQMQLKMAIFSV